MEKLERIEKDSQKKARALNERILEACKVFNRLHGIENTRKNVRDTKKWLGDLIKVGEREIEEKPFRAYITIEELKSRNLKDIYDDNKDYYIKGTSTPLHLKKQPLKGGDIRYYASGLSINLLEKNNIDTVYIAKGDGKNEY